jgi:hypothetical protein
MGKNLKDKTPTFNIESGKCLIRSGQIKYEKLKFFGQNSES